MGKCSAVEDHARGRFASGELREVKDAPRRARGLSPARVWVGIGRVPARLLCTKPQLCFSCFRVPAPAGVSDWYENSLPCRRTASQTRLYYENSLQGEVSLAKKDRMLRHSREGGNPEGAGGARPPPIC